MIYIIYYNYKLYIIYTFILYINIMYLLYIIIMYLLFYFYRININIIIYKSFII